MGFAASGAGEQARLRLRGRFDAGSAAELRGFYRLAASRKGQKEKTEEERRGGERWRQRGEERIQRRREKREIRKMEERKERINGRGRRKVKEGR